MGGFSIDPDGLRRGADGFDEIINRLTASLTSLETKLKGYGAPWGSGLIGQTIGALYEEVHDLAMSTFEGNAEVISEYAQGLDTIADTLEQNEMEIENNLLDVETEINSTFNLGGRP
jgi:hypothetical protein